MRLEKQISDLIDMVKAVAPHVWDIAIRQVYVEAAQSAGACLFLMGISYALIRTGLKHYDDTWEHEDFFMPCFIAGGIVGLCALIAVLCMGGSIIQAILNPEYAAIRLLKP